MAKDTFNRRLRLSGSGPEVIHFPKGLLKTVGTIYDFLKGLVSIRRKTDVKTGKTWWEDKKGNEAIHCWLYAYAALQLLKERHPDVQAAITREPTGAPEPYSGTDHSAPAGVDESTSHLLDMRDAGPAKLLAGPTVKPPAPPPQARKSAHVASAAPRVEPRAEPPAANPYTAPRPQTMVVRSS